LHFCSLVFSWRLSFCAFTCCRRAAPRGEGLTPSVPRKKRERKTQSGGRGASNQTGAIYIFIPGCSFPVIHIELIRLPDNGTCGACSSRYRSTHSTGLQRLLHASAMHRSETAPPGRGHPDGKRESLDTCNSADVTRIPSSLSRQTRRRQQPLHVAASRPRSMDASRSLLRKHFHSRTRPTPEGRTRERPSEKRDTTALELSITDGAPAKRHVLLLLLRPSTRGGRMAGWKTEGGVGELLDRYISGAILLHFDGPRGDGYGC
jgi:hypothetical protein